ncbi:MAG TPA: response regulator transcription factor [Burkholderiales bacterium]|nr:response regulator transcription factor [Burkholderiales bacterium]
MRILIVEDEPALQQQIRSELEKLSYTVDATGDGKEAYYLASEYLFDAAIVDLGLPGLSGLDVIARLRSEGSQLPILILTARASWQDKVSGLETGGDDYLTKPFQMEELSARLKALLRRASGASGQVLHCGPVTLDIAGQQVSVDGHQLELTGYEYKLLEHLVRERRRVLSKDDLAAHLYPHDEESDSNVIEVLVARLRKKLDPGGTLQPIETLRGRGYRFRLGSD